jgi:hypothetical protein
MLLLISRQQLDIAAAHMPLSWGKGYKAAKDYKNGFKYVLGLSPAQLAEHSPGKAMKA